MKETRKTYLDYCGNSQLLDYKVQLGKNVHNDNNTIIESQRIKEKELNSMCVYMYVCNI